MLPKMQTLHLICVISFLDLFAIGLNMPLFSTYIRALGASHTTVGLLSSIYSGTQVISGPLIGGWSDVRDRKSVLKITLLLCALCYSLIGLTQSMFLIFCLRFILGFFKHTQSICKAVITNLVPIEEQSAVFGKIAALSSLGFIIGPFLGGHLSEIDNGFTYVCLLTSLLLIITYVVTTFLPEDTKKIKNQHIPIMATVKNEFSKTVRELREINWSEQWDVFLLKFLTGLTVTTYFSNQSIYLKEKYQLSPKQLGYTISYFSIIGMISSFFLNRIENLLKTTKSTPYQKLTRSFLVLTISFLLIYISDNLYILISLLIPISFSMSALRVILMDLMFRKSQSGHSGSLSGASNSVMSVARFITPLMTGLTSDILGEESVMMVAVVPASVGLFTSIVMNRRFLRRGKDD